MKIFKEAYKLIQENKVSFELIGNQGIFYKIKDYSYRIYLKTSMWFGQCGCKVGVSNKPQGLCKHSIASLVEYFLKANKLKLVKNDRLE